MRKTTDSLFPTLFIASLLLAGACKPRAAEAPPATTNQASAAAPASAGNPAAMTSARVHYQAMPTTNTAVTIQGTSTFHDWEMKGPNIGGFLEFPVGVSFDTNQAALPGLANGLLPVTGQATIPVRNIHAQVEHLPDVMDGLMQDALKQTNYAAIQYKVSELKLVQPHLAGQPFTFDATGNLAIAGVTNKVSFPVTITLVDKTKIKITGSAKLKMTDFKVQPPAPSIAGLGVMKCGDEVTILFDWTLAPRQTQP
jgi:polyisoprenoid-binding protein YceI